MTPLTSCAALTLTFIVVCFDVQCSVAHVGLRRRIFPATDQMPRRHYEYQTEDPPDVIASIQAAEAGDFVVAMASSAGSAGTDSTSCALDADSSLIAACRKLVISSFKDSFIYPVVGLRAAPPSGSLGQQTPLEIFRFSESVDLTQSSGDYQATPCHRNDLDDDCTDVTSGSGSNDVTVFFDEEVPVNHEDPITDIITSPADTPSPAENNSMVIVIDMTERLPALRHRQQVTSVPRLLVYHVQSVVNTPTTEHAKLFSSSWRHLQSKSEELSPYDQSTSAVMIERPGHVLVRQVILNVGLIVGIAGGLSALVFLLSAVIYCRLLHAVSASTARIAASEVKPDQKESTGAADVETVRCPHPSSVVTSGACSGTRSTHNVINCPQALTAHSKPLRVNEWFV